MRYNKYLGLKEVNRAILMMNYDSSLTLNENVLYVKEQTGPGITSFNTYQPQPEKKKEETKFGYVDVPEYNKIPGFDTIKTPSGGAIYVPSSATTINSFFTNKTTYENFKLFRDWVGTTWDGWIPKGQDIKKMLNPISVSSFSVNGTSYSANFMNKKFTSKDATPNPSTWEFVGYFDNNNKQYIPPKIQDSRAWWEKKWDEWGTVIQNILIIIATIASAFVTFGGSLLAELPFLIRGTIQILASARFQVVSSLAFSALSFSRGNEFEGVMMLVFAVLPTLHKIPFVKKYTDVKVLSEKIMTKLSKANIKTGDDLMEFYNTLKGSEKKLFEDVMKNKDVLGPEIKDVLQQANKVLGDDAKKIWNQSFKIGAGFTKQALFDGILIGLGWLLYNVSGIKMTEEQKRRLEKVYIKLPDEKLQLLSDYINNYKLSEEIINLLITNPELTSKEIMSSDTTQILMNRLDSLSKTFDK